MWPIGDISVTTNGAVNGNNGDVDNNDNSSRTNSAVKYTSPVWSGFQFEGIFRKHMILPTGPRDSAWYGIVEDDWPAVKARLSTRVDAKLSA